MHRCRQLIHSALGDGGIFQQEIRDGEVVEESWILLYFGFNTFGIFGFLDDFALRTGRPAGEYSRLRATIPDIQRAFYSGYFRAHGLKAQVVWLPIGIIGCIFITEIRQNDNGVQNMSGLNDYLVELLQNDRIGVLFPVLFCDGIFAVLATICPRFVNPNFMLKLLNMRLGSLRQVIELVFKDHHTRFKLFHVPRY